MWPHLKLPIMDILEPEPTIGVKRSVINVHVVLISCDSLGKLEE